jgi:hypothetical protein
MPIEGKVRSLLDIWSEVFLYIYVFQWMILGRNFVFPVFLENSEFLHPHSPKGEGVYCFTSVRPSVPVIFRRIFLSNCWWQKSDIWSQPSYMYTILWVAFLDPSDSYFLFADLLLPTIWHTYMKLVTKYHIPVINSCWEKCAYTNVC